MAKFQRSQLRRLIQCVYGVAFCIGMSSLSMARDPDAIIEIWPNGAPGEPMKVGPEQDFTKPSDKLIAGRKIIKLGNVTKPEAHVFLPPNEKRNGTAVVICPGGGFSILAWDLEGIEVAEWLNSQGVIGIVLKYRVPTREQKEPWLAPVQDIQRTVKIVAMQGREWGIVPERIGLLGFSAGGQAVAIAATRQQEHFSDVKDGVDKAEFHVGFAIIIYPGGLIDNATGQLRDVVKVSKDSPPMFFAHAQDDGAIVENSVLMFLALKKAGVPTELHVYDTGGHGYGLRPVPELPVTAWPDRCADWMKRRGLLVPAKK